jgi:hypothetical protein
MEENQNNKQPIESENKKQDCGCDDDCCQPKKKNIFSKLIFALILLAAVAIIGIKLVGRSGNASDKQSVAAPGKVSICDTAKTKTCDTTKSSSCCPKK